MPVFPFVFQLVTLSSSKYVNKSNDAYCIVAFLLVEGSFSVCFILALDEIAFSVINIILQYSEII